MQTAKSTPVRLSVTLILRQGRCTSRKTNRLAVPLRFAVVSLELARSGRDRLPHLADQLGRALIKTDYRALSIGRLRIEVEHIFHTGDKFAIHLRNAPHVFAPRLEVVFGQPAAHGFAGETVVCGKLDQFTRQ